jgi:hypothetical protein
MKRAWLYGTILVVSSCGGDPSFSDRPAPEGGVIIPIPLPDAADPFSEGGNGTACPDSEPKIGDYCPPGFSEGNSCTFVLGHCTAPNGNVYSDAINYCCIQGLWVTCGGMSMCDTLDAGPAADAPVADGGSPDGGPADALGNDAEQDL